MSNASIWGTPGDLTAAVNKLVAGMSTPQPAQPTSNKPTSNKPASDKGDLAAAVDRMIATQVSHD